MTTSTATLTTFLLARLAEDEEIARAATGERWTWWNLEGRDQGWAGQGPDLQTVTDEFKACPYPGCRWTEGDPNHRGESGRPGHWHRATETVLTAWGHDAWGVSIEDSDAKHIARHDPARVLAECEAKRRIVELHTPGSRTFIAGSGEVSECPTCAWTEDDWSRTDMLYPCPTLLALASVYRDHPEFREEWA